MKTRDELIKLGMYPSRRKDSVYILGNMYDFLIENPNVSQKDILNKIEELRQYLDKHRELIDNMNEPIVLASSVLRALKEDFNFTVKRKDIIKKQQESLDILQKTGVYGIYIENELVYIGKTVVNFKTRFNRHKSEIEKGTDSLLYNALRNAKEKELNVVFKPLIIIEDLKFEGKSKKKITLTDVKLIEFSLITLFQPKYNIEGRFIPYDFDHK